MTKAIGSMLAHDSVGVRKYCSTLDKHLSRRMWNALQDSNRKVKKRSSGLMNRFVEESKGPNQSREENLFVAQDCYTQ